MKLSSGGSVTLRAPEQGQSWAGDLGVTSAEGMRPSAAVYLTAEECERLGQWLLVMSTRARRRALWARVVRWFS